MALQGKSFSIDSGKIDGLYAKIKTARARADKLTMTKMNAAVNVVWGIAHAKRPMITKAMMKAQGRRSRVSDPSAEAGVPVRTGALQMSITKSVSKNGNVVTGKVETNSPYAKFLEFGTSRMPARPFMRPALALSGETVKKIFEKQ
jgi:HK97 gp10 family phage protein